MKKKFIDTLVKIANCGSQGKVFDDFLTIAATSLAAKSTCASSVREEREKLFADTVSRYDKQAQVLFADMLAFLGLALNESISNKNYRDVLGEIFQELQLNEQKNGQVFTPKHIGDLSGKLILDEDFIKREIDRAGCITIVEPCCGSATLTFGGLNAVLSAGFNPNFFCRVIAYDLDLRCVLMTYIQLYLYAIPAVILQRNAITDEILNSPFYTPFWYQVHEKVER